MKKRTIFNSSQFGFTLLEVLIALAIFSLLAIISTIGVRTVINTFNRVSAVDERTREILLATIILRRDISQMIDRPVLDENGLKKKSLVTSAKENIQFTRAGYTNPAGVLPRSSLQRIEYSFKEHSLIRTSWSALDLMETSKPQATILLKGIKSIYFSYVDGLGKVVDTWSTNVNQAQIFPRAIIVTLRLQEAGQLQMIIPIRGHGNALY